MKRSRHIIILQILSICESCATKTRIVYQANLNFKTVNPYINLLMKRGLITANRGSPNLYETTDRGKDLLRSLKQIHSELAEA